MLVNELIDAGLRSQTLVEQVGTWHWIGEWQSSVRLNNLVEARFDALDEPARELLELIALAEPVTLAALRTACDAARPGSSFLDDIARLERVELAEIDTMNGDLHVAHPLYGEVLRASLPQARLHHHALVLAHLPDDGRPEREVRAVRWKIDAGMDVPAPVLLHAATVAHEREDLRNASMLARRAMESGELVRSGRLLGLIYEQLGDVASATEALTVAAEAAIEPSDIFLVAMSRAELAFAHQDDPAAAQALLDEVETRVPGTAEWLLPPRAMQTLLFGEPMEALAITEPLIARDDETPALFGVVTTLGLALTGRANEAVAVARRAIAARADLDGHAVARHELFATALVFALVETGGLSEARAVAQEGLQDAQRTGAMQAEGWFALARATTELAGSRTVDAGAWFAESAARFSPFASPVERWASSGAALAAALRGDAEQARSLLDHTDAFGPTCWRFLDPLVARARGWAAAAADDRETAVKVFEDAAAHAHAHHLFSLEAVLAADLVRLGAPELGRQRLDVLATLMDNPRVPHWAAYAKALATGDAEGLVRAARAMNGVGAVSEAADAYAQAAALLWQQGNQVDATEAAAMARAHAKRAQDISTPALRELDTVPPLTDRQVEIAQMAADGLPSREIAKRLVVSVRTVDNHLARIFRTFGISTRAELGEILAAWRPAPSESSARPPVTA
jgi:DNA-binding NarL/FixJ family response regulator